jgi:hypothetical protein
VLAMNGKSGGDIGQSLVFRCQTCRPATPAMVDGDAADNARRVGAGILQTLAIVRVEFQEKRKSRGVSMLEYLKRLSLVVSWSE